MKRKHLLVATFLTAALAFGSTAQAHEDYALPLVLGGVILGLSLDHDDYHHHDHYYRDRYDHRYHHREYRRHDSHGYWYGDKRKRDHGHGRYDHHRDGRR